MLISRSSIRNQSSANLQVITRCSIREVMRFVLLNAVPVVNEGKLVDGYSLDVRHAPQFPNKGYFEGVDNEREAKSARRRAKAVSAKISPLNTTTSCPSKFRL